MRRGPSRGASAARPSRSPSGTAPGASRSTDGRTVDFTPLPGSIEDDLATRDFTINAIALPLAGGEAADPFEGRNDLGSGSSAPSRRASSRTTRCGCCAPSGSRTSSASGSSRGTERLVREQAGLVTRPAGERILAELLRLSVRRAGSGWTSSACSAARRLVGARRSRRCGRHARVPPRRLPRGQRGNAADLTPAAAVRDHAAAAEHPARGRLATGDPPLPPPTEPWALEALASRAPGRPRRGRAGTRRASPGSPLVRGDELGLPPGPEIGQALERIAEERAAGTISTRQEALGLVRRELGE